MATDAVERAQMVVCSLGQINPIHDASAELLYTWLRQPYCCQITVTIA